MADSPLEVYSAGETPTLLHAPCVGASRRDWTNCRMAVSEVDEFRGPTVLMPEVSNILESGNFGPKFRFLPPVSFRRFPILHAAEDRIAWHVQRAELVLCFAAICGVDDEEGTAWRLGPAADPETRLSCGQLWRALTVGEGFKEYIRNSGSRRQRVRRVR